MLRTTQWKRGRKRGQTGTMIDFMNDMGSYNMPAKHLLGEQEGKQDTDEERTDEYMNEDRLATAKHCIALHSHC